MDGRERRVGGSWCMVPRIQCKAKTPLQPL
jgi:hypothetical protein